MSCEHWGLNNPFRELSKDVPTRQLYVVALLRRRKAIPEGSSFLKKLRLYIPCFEESLFRGIANTVKQINTEKTSARDRLEPGDVLYANANHPFSCFLEGYCIIMMPRQETVVVSGEAFIDWHSMWFLQNHGRAFYPVMWRSFVRRHDLERALKAVNCYDLQEN